LSAATAVALVASYLVGSIPASYLVGRAFRGIDLREHGSRNLGATNLYRVMGAKFAIPVGLFDALKGAVPVLVFAPMAGGSRLFGLVCGLAAVVGHMFSPFVGFKGGKGVATAAGVMTALTPLAAAVCLVVWLALVFTTGYVSLGSIAAAAVLPIAVYLLHPDARLFLWLDALIAALIIWMHRANIKRLLAGTENRFGRRAAAEQQRSAR
jgi:glycerol-3-phosphate acyltransferase PlsY